MCFLVLNGKVGVLVLDDGFLCYFNDSFVIIKVLSISCIVVKCFKIKYISIWCCGNILCIKWIFCDSNGNDCMCINI